MLPKSRCVLDLYPGRHAICAHMWIPGERFPSLRRPPRRRRMCACLVSIFSVLNLPWDGKRVPVAGLRLCTCQFFATFLLGSRQNPIAFLARPIIPVIRDAISRAPYAIYGT